MLTQIVIKHSKVHPEQVEYEDSQLRRICVFLE